MIITVLFSGGRGFDDDEVLGRARVCGRRSGPERVEVEPGGRRGGGRVLLDLLHVIRVHPYAEHVHLSRVRKRGEADVVIGRHVEVEMGGGWWRAGA